MSRTALAFLIAPLWVPAVTALLAIYVIFPYPEQHRWVHITILISAIFAYGGALTLGVPTFLLLRVRKRTAFWIFPLLGFAVGALTGLIFFVLFGLSCGLSLSSISYDLPKILASWPFLATGALGTLVGTTLWLIARPDRVRWYSPACGRPLM